MRDDRHVCMELGLKVEGKLADGFDLGAAGFGIFYDLLFGKTNDEPAVLNEKIVAVAQKTARGMKMVSQQSYAEAYHLIKAENQKAIILLAATLVMIFLSSLLVSKWLTAPIRNLTEVADKYSQGQLDLVISGLDRNDEIGQLGQAIERLGTSIRLAMNRLQKKKGSSQ